MESEIDTLSLTDSEELYKQDGGLDDSQPSPFSKSRYGRTRKPKISQDFYDIDAILDTVKDNKKSPRATHAMKSPLITKVLKSKSSQSLTDDEDTKKTRDGRTQFIHVTGDSELEDILVPPDYNNDLNVTGSSEDLIETENTVEVSDQNTLEGNVINTESTSVATLGEETLSSINTLDVSEVLKIIAPTRNATDSDASEASDSKSNSKPTLKTYTNRRKCFNKPGIVESFGLPDKPIFPLDENKSTLNEPKRYKNLDVASTSDTDINLVDKRLLNTPWKIASINTDMSTSETLLDPTYADASDNRLEDDVLVPVNGYNDANIPDNVKTNSVTHSKYQSSDAIKKGSDLNDNIKRRIIKVTEKNPLENNITIEENSIIKQSKNEDKHSSRSKSKHKHKSTSKHHHKHKSSETQKLLKSDTEVVNTQHKKHKSSKSKNRHERKPLSISESDVIDSKEKPVEDVSDLRKQLKTKDKLPDVLGVNKDILVKQTSLAKLKHSLTDKLLKNAPISSSTSKHNTKHEPITSTKPIIKTEGKNNNENLAFKKKLSKSSNRNIKEMFIEPLFSVPDGTIRQVPLKDNKTKVDTNLKIGDKIKSSTQNITKENIQNKSDSIKIQTQTNVEPNKVSKEQKSERVDSKFKVDDSNKEGVIKKKRDESTTVKSRDKDITPTANTDIKKHKEIKNQTESIENSRSQDVLRTEKKNKDISNSSVRKNNNDSLITSVSDINKNDASYIKDAKKNKSLTHHHNKDCKVSFEQPDNKQDITVTSNLIRTKASRKRYDDYPTIATTGITLDPKETKTVAPDEIETDGLVVKNVINIEAQQDEMSLVSDNSNSKYDERLVATTTITLVDKPENTPPAQENAKSSMAVCEDEASIDKIYLQFNKALQEIDSVSAEKAEEQATLTDAGVQIPHDDENRGPVTEVDHNKSVSSDGTLLAKSIEPLQPSEPITTDDASISKQTLHPKLPTEKKQSVKELKVLINNQNYIKSKKDLQGETKTGKLRNSASLPVITSEPTRSNFKKGSNVENVKVLENIMFEPEKRRLSRRITSTPLEFKTSERKKLDTSKSEALIATPTTDKSIISTRSSSKKYIVDDNAEASTSKKEFDNKIQNVILNTVTTPKPKNKSQTSRKSHEKQVTNKPAGTNTNLSKKQVSNAESASSDEVSKSQFDQATKAINSNAVQTEKPTKITPNKRDPSKILKEEITKSKKGNLSHDTETPTKVRGQPKRGISNSENRRGRSLDRSVIPLLSKDNISEGETPIKRTRRQTLKALDLSDSPIINKKPKQLKPFSSVDLIAPHVRSTSRQRRAVSLCCITKDDIHKKVTPATLKIEVSLSPGLKRSKRNLVDLLKEHNSFSAVRPSEVVNQKASTSQNKKRTSSISDVGRAKHNSSIDRTPVKSAKKSLGSVKPKLLDATSKGADLQQRIEPTNVQVGDLMWAKLGNFPYWPCLIMKDPESGVFKKTRVFRNKSNLWYHLRFYGDKGRRGWIRSKLIMRFDNPDDLSEISNWLKMQSGAKSALQPYIVKPRSKLHWNVAVAEASFMKSKTVDERLEFFTTMLKPNATSKKKSLLPPTSEEGVSSPKVSKVISNRETTLMNTEDVNRRFVRSKSLPAVYIKSSKRTSVDENPIKKMIENRDIVEIKKNHSSPLPKFAQSNEKENSPQLLLDETKIALNIKLEKRDVDKINEAHSECSLSDSDTFSKSSSTASTRSRFQDLITRQKRNSIFKGISKHRVCQICTQPREVLKCQGPCNGMFHEKCAKSVIFPQNSLSKTEDVSLINKTMISEKDSILDTHNHSKTIYTVSSTNDKILDSDSKPSSTPTSITYSIAEQIDLKMKEVMSFQESYADSTTDYTSSEETVASSVSLAENNIKKKSFKKHSESVLLKKNVSKDKSLLLKPTQNCGSPIPDEFKCQYCILDVAPPCFVCGKEVSAKDDSVRQKCSLKNCGRFYHHHCLKLWPQTQWSLISTVKLKNSDKDLETFVCPTHVCHTCSSDNPRSPISRCRSDQVVKCLRCPATYHSTNYCVPAGTQILTNSQIICPRHFESQKKNKSHKGLRTINTAWCFICSKGGDLVCCETCPTSVHTECLHVDFMEDGTFVCEDCESGRFPLYDEIVWVKLGTYRWWPATILFPTEVPDNIQNIKHNKGEFVVKFFGTHDHYWINRGRVFLFQEGDRALSSPVKTKVDISFKKSVEEAAKAHQLKNAFAQSIKAEIQTDNKPPPYIKVKINKPVGNVRSLDPNVSNTTSCECSPTQKSPCGPESDCINRILLTECDPTMCPAKDKCNNQRFEKRQYPPLVPYKTEARGWGLKALAPIRKGEFVIEYVGELIDEQEYQRRIHKMHEQKEENYYFLTIDKDRIIDAGPKGNLARFMNHCCDPNCATQKWTVNGETRVGLFALMDIPAESELTFNYQLQCIGKEKKICACGALKCCGFIGGKTKLDESQKKVKKNSSIKRKRGHSMPPVIKINGPCFVCGKSGNVGACQNKICTKLYHLKCVNLKLWPEGKWVCPWHNCNICAKRTIRCCVKCINSYCPVHSDGNVRYETLLGFLCSEHDPTKESHDDLDQSVNSLKATSSAANIHTEETDVTSTTVDESEQTESSKSISQQTSTSTVTKKKNLTNFVVKLEVLEGDFTAVEFENKSKQKELTQTSKRKRGFQKKNVGNPLKKIKMSSEVVKPTPTYSSPSILDIPPQNEVKLSSTIPTRHLRTTRKVSTESEIKQLIKRQSEYEKDLPIRKRTRPRCEVNL